MKINLIKFAAIAILFTAISNPSLAARSGSSADRFHRLANKIYTNPERYEFIDLTLEDLDKKSFTELLSAAEYESERWADTILEGDYSLSEDPLTLNSVSAVYNHKGQLLAYRITFSQRGWDTASCDFPYEEFEAGNISLEEAHKDCTEGFISGAAYVSPDFQESTRDDENPESFD